MVTDAALDPRVLGYAARQRALAEQARNVPMPLRRVMVFYGRISAIYDDSEYSVPLQISEGEELFASEFEPNGWVWGEPVEDEGIGATERSRSRKKRAGFARLVRMLETGEAHGIMAYDSSRLARNVPDALRLCEVIERRPYIRIHFTSSGEVHNLNTADGRAAFLTAIVRAEQETAKMVERCIRGRKRAAKAGKLPRRANLGFGFPEYKPVPRPLPADFDPARDREMIPAEQVEAEQKALRDGLRMLLDGHGLQAIANEWNARGVLTRTGKLWSGDAVRVQFQRPYLAGYAVHQGSIVGDLRGGEDARIVDRGQWHRAVELLAAQSKGRKNARSLCGVGLIRCARCGETFHRLTDNKRGPRYQCKIRADRTDGHRIGCGMSVSAPWMDGQVKAATIARLSSPENAAAIAERRAGDVEREAEVARLRAQLAEELETANLFDAKRANGQMPLERYKVYDAQCQQRIAELRAQIDAATSADDDVLRLGAAGDVAQAWADAEAAGDLKALQAMIRAAFPRLTVAANDWDGKRARWSRPSRIWWDGEGQRVSPVEAVA